jgi:hypothetical protein
VLVLNRNFGVIFELEYLKIQQKDFELCGTQMNEMRRSTDFTLEVSAAKVWGTSPTRTGAAFASETCAAIADNLSPTS